MKDNLVKESDGYFSTVTSIRESVVKDNAVIIVRLLSEYSHSCQRESVVTDNPVIKVTDSYGRVCQMSCRQSKFLQKAKQFTNI